LLLKLEDLSGAQAGLLEGFLREDEGGEDAPPECEGDLLLK
jgi:hypothetical protein